MEGEWELSKENIQPRKDGRAINSLIAGLTPRKELMLQRASEMQRYEQAIRRNEGSDPLEDWYKYIVWTEQNSPDGGSLEVKQILERCIQHFEVEEKYRDDPRYVKIWIKYADIIRDPLELFNYMYDKSIGSTHTAFYENWADALESVENFQKADEVYQLGIARNAQPLLRLQRLHESFMHRLAAKVKGDVDNFPHQDDEQRTSLASLRHTKSGKVDHDRVKARSGKSAGGLKIQSGQKQIQAKTVVVFEDECAPESKVPSARGEWKEPPINSKIVKENTSKPAKWTSSKISSKPSNHHSQPAFMIHEDAALELKPDRTPKQVVMSDRKPLSSKKVVKEATHNPFDAIQKKDDCQFVERYCKSDVYLGNQEFSLEELRALEPKYAVLSSVDDRTTHFPADMEETCVLGTELRPVIEHQDENAMPISLPHAEMQSANQVDLGRKSFAPENETLQLMFKDERSGTTRQRLNFSSTIDKKTTSKTNHNLSLHAKYSDNLDVSTLDSLDDMEFFMAGPTESTSRHNISRLPHPSQFKGMRDVLKDSEITVIETKSNDSSENMKYYGLKERNEVQGIPEFKDGRSLFQGSSCDEPSGADVPTNSIFEGDAFEDKASLSGLGPDIEFGQPYLGDKKADVVRGGANFPLYSDMDTDPQQKAGCWIKAPPSLIKPKAQKMDLNFGPSSKETTNSEEGSSRDDLSFKHSDRKAPTVFEPQAPANAAKDYNGVFDLFKKPTNPKSGLGETTLSEKEAFFDDIDNAACKQLKRQPVQQLTPVTKDKRFTAHPYGQAFPMPPKSPIWAPSPTFHTKVATQAIHEMWRAADFTIDSTIEASNDFEQQFGEKSCSVPKDRFQIFQDDTNCDFENEAQPVVTREDQRRGADDGMKTAQPTSCSNGFVDAQQMSLSKGQFEYTISEQMVSNMSTKNSTPLFPDGTRPELSCTAIGNLHDSEMQHADSSHQVACDTKNLSTIQEQSGESLSDQFRKSSSSSSRGFSEGSESNIDAVCSTLINKQVQNMPPVFGSDEVARHKSAGSSAVSSSAAGESNYLKRFLDAETSHVEGALHSLALNTTVSNVSVSGKSFAAKPVDVSGSKAITAIVKTMEFEIYPNLIFETDNSLQERFFVNSKVNLGNDEYKIVQKVATGGFAVVYCAHDLNRSGNEETALKVMTSPGLCQWEFHIGTQIQKRLVQNSIDPGLHDCFIQPLTGYVYSDAAVIQFPYHPGGTLLDLVNMHLKEKVGQTDTFALMYGLNVCKLVKAMHDCSIIHGDVKPDNFLLNRIAGNFDSPVDLNCLTLADFGRCLDLTLYSKTVTFVGSCNTDKFECIEMKKNLPWKYQVDYYGVAGTIHVVLHGTYLDCFLSGDRYKTVKVCSRRQGKEFWASVFDRLLNVSDCNDQTVLEGVIKDFERRLSEPERHKALMELLNLQRAMTSS